MTLKCATCGIADEDYTHLWNCPNNTELVYNTVKAVTIATYREQFEFDFREDEQTLLDILTPTGIPDFLPDLARGFVIKPFKEAMEAILNSPSKAATVIKFISNNLRCTFRENIWLQRCVAQSNLEKHKKISKKYKHSTFEPPYNTDKVDKLRRNVKISGLANNWFHDMIQNGGSYGWAPNQI